MGNRGLSTHKLRHTAATLMYQYGNVDPMVLKEILGSRQCFHHGDIHPPYQR